MLGEIKEQLNVIQDSQLDLQELQQGLQDQVNQLQQDFDAFQNGCIMLTIHVDDTPDALLDNDGLCSLREAIDLVNGQKRNKGVYANGCEILRTGGTLEPVTYRLLLPNMTHTLALGGRGENDNQQGDLDIFSLDNLEIVGSGQDNTIIQAGTSPGSGLDRVFDVLTSLTDTAVTVAFRDMTLRHGDVQGPTGGAGMRLDLSSLTTVELWNVTVSSNVR